VETPNGYEHRPATPEEFAKLNGYSRIHSRGSAIGSNGQTYIVIEVSK
jgi:hypothetical protein